MKKRVINLKKKLQKAFEFFADPGRGNRKCFCYYTNNLSKISKPEKNIQVFLKTTKEIIKMINLRKFNNSAHIAAFFFCINKL